MNASLIIVQCLNGLQLGIFLFLMAAGLTLVFGVMNFVNLAHGSLYMLGAFIAATIYNVTASFYLAALSTIPAMLLIGTALELIALRPLYKRTHLDQVLATFGLILFFNELTRCIWGPSPYYMDLPDSLSGTIDILGIQYSVYRFVIIATGLVVAAGCYFLIHKTRVGMLIRAGSTHREMVSALGINIAQINTLLFALGSMLAGIAGVMAGPILSIQPGMGEPMLILTLVVIVIGGVGSVRGAFLAAIIVGVIDTAGRTLLPALLRVVLDRTAADGAGPALASILVYLVMALVLVLRPAGLFPVRHG